MTTSAAGAPTTRGRHRRPIKVQVSISTIPTFRGALLRGLDGLGQYALLPSVVVTAPTGTIGTTSRHRCLDPHRRHRRRRPGQNSSTKSRSSRQAQCGASGFDPARSSTADVRLRRGRQFLFHSAVVGPVPPTPPTARPTSTTAGDDQRRGPVERLEPPASCDRGRDPAEDPPRCGGHLLVQLDPAPPRWSSPVTHPGPCGQSAVGVQATYDGGATWVCRCAGGTQRRPPTRTPSRSPTTKRPTASRRYRPRVCRTSRHGLPTSPATGRCPTS